MEKYYITSDLSLAAYLTVKGLDLIKAKKVESGKFEFIIDDNEGKADLLAIEYINSDFCKFDNQIRTIKKLLYKNN